MIYYFYKIVCDDLPNFVYVGSTMSYANRKYEHKSDCNNENRKHYNYKIYQTIRANGGWDNWRMVCIHQQEVDNKRHAEQIEEQYRVELNGNMNMIRAFLSPEQKKEDYNEYNKEYYEQNKNHILEHQKEYRENNKDKISEKKKEKITCDCGREIRRDSLLRHKLSQKHIKLVEDI
jgi:hypothetical protein